MKVQFLRYLSTSIATSKGAFTELNSLRDLNEVRNILTKENIVCIHIYDINEDDLNHVYEENNQITLSYLNLPLVFLHVKETTPKFIVNIGHSVILRFKLIYDWECGEDVNNINNVDINIYTSNITYFEIEKCNTSVRITNTFINKVILYSNKIEELKIDTSYITGFQLNTNKVEIAYFNDCDLSYSDIRRNTFKHLSFTNVKLKGSKHYDNTVDGSTYEDNFEDCQYFNNICPKEGSFIGWKKCKIDTGVVLVKLLIPENAKRSSGTSFKCRCDKAQVLEIRKIPTERMYPMSEQHDENIIDEEIDECYSMRDCDFKYRKGEYVEVPDFNTDPFVICSSGIHFFMNKKLAINYNL